MTLIRLSLKLAGLLLLITVALCALALVWGISRRAPLLAAQIMAESTFDSDIYLIDPNLLKVINLTRSSDWIDFTPTWTPDNRLGYIAVEPQTKTNELRIYDLAAH